MDYILDELEIAFPHAAIIDLIFYPDIERLPEQVVDEALRREAEWAAKQ